MTDDAAYLALCRWRWEGGKPACPRCGSTDKYELRNRRVFKCAGCYHQYTATSGTAFHRHKLTPEQIMTFLSLYPASNAHQIAKAMGVQYVTAWALVKKMAATP